ncbi:Alpha/Beta hydrolase protein [Mycena olivaceomarginata]|nr:Alpha/Beta hydrolase protein [Mycena olivaceomarginata]
MHGPSLKKSPPSLTWNLVAQLIVSRISFRPNREGQDGEVVAIIAQSDTVLYHAIVAGLMMADLIPFPISPRNSFPGMLQLLRATSCHRIAATCSMLEPLLAGLKIYIADVDPEFALEIQEVPSLLDAYPNLGAETENCPFQPYPTKYRTPQSCRRDPRMLKQWIILPPVADVRAEAEHWEASRSYGSAAFSTYSAIWEHLVQPLGRHLRCSVPTNRSFFRAHSPLTPSADNILEHARMTSAVARYGARYVGHLVLNLRCCKNTVKTLDRILFAGGPLPQRIGDDLVKQGLRLISAYGATEFGTLSSLIPYEDDIKEWAWFRVSPLVKVRWAPQGGGTFECQILAWENHTAMVDNLDDIKGYATSDLCVNHPQKKHLWKLVGRLDEVITHSSGEKTVPGPMLDIIMSSPHITGAVMFGRERLQTGILIETTPELQINVHNATQLAELRNKIWPIIEEANENAPAFSRIFKEMILIASSDKPLPRAGKGTVQSKAAIILYAQEIESLYNTMEEQISAIDVIEPPAVWRAAPIEEWLLRLAGNVCNCATMSSTVELRQQGFDSLTATIFRLHLVRALRSRKDTLLARGANAIPQDLTHAYPTISQLATFVEGLASGVSTPVNGRLETGNSVADTDSPFSLDDEIVEMCSGPGIPLIVFSGMTGRLGPLLALRAHFSGTLWAVQVIKTTPTTQLSRHAEFLVEKILQKQPNGPYRLAAYSGSGVLGVAVAKLLEKRGAWVVQLTFIDHFPLLFAHHEDERSLREEFAMKQTVQSIIDMLNADPLFLEGSERITHLKAALAGSPDVSESVQGMIEGLRRFGTPLCEFLAEFYAPNAESSSFADALSGWVSSVRAPFSLIIAEFGVNATVAEASREAWADLGAHLCGKPVAQRIIPGVGHHGILADKRTATILQEWESS